MTCVSCTLHKYAINPALPPEGEGPILIVLDEVASEYDLNATYYAGKSGQLLDGILEDAGLRREDCTVVGLTRCYGTPEREQISLCVDLHLKKLVNERLFSTIIATGDSGLGVLTGKSGLKDKRGQSFPLHKRFEVDGTVWPTYSLQLVRRVPTYRGVVSADIRRAVSSSRSSEELKWEWWDGQELPDSDVYAYDIETIPENFDGSNYTETATQCAIATVDLCFVSRPNMESANALAEALMRKVQDLGSKIVGHNSWNFDVPRTRLASHGLAQFPLGEDTMVLAYLQDETQPKGLETLCVKNLGVKGWKDEFEYPLGSDEFALYNARDVVYTLRLYRHLCAALGNRVDLVDGVLRPAHIALTKMSERGVWINADAVAREKANAQTIADASNAKIAAIVGPLFDAKGKPKKFNPNSSKQLGEWLESKKVYLPETEKGSYSTGEEILRDYTDNPVVGDCITAVLNLRGANKTLGTYVKNYEKIINEGDGRVHPTYSITRTKTGRSAAKSQNIQNMPRAYKDFFGAPPGKVFVEVDWSSIEFRLAAWVAQEQTILARYKENPDWDAHRFFAADLYGIPESKVTKDQRQIAKSGNFGLLFMGNGMTLVNYAKGLGLDLSLQFCTRVHDKWHEIFPGFRKFYAATERELLSTNESRTAVGFVRHYGNVKLLPKHLQFAALREAVNVKIQGLAAYLAFMAAGELDRKGLPANGFYHDAFSFEFEAGTEGEYIPLIEEIMCNYPRKAAKELFGINLDIPLTVETKIHQ